MAKPKRNIKMRHTENERIERERIERQEENAREQARHEKEKALQAEREARAALVGGTPDRPGSEEFITPEPVASIRRHKHTREFMYSLNDHGLEGLPDLALFMPTRVTRTIAELPGSCDVHIEATLNDSNANRLHAESEAYRRRSDNEFVPYLMRYEGTIYNMQSIQFEPREIIEMDTIDGMRQRVTARPASLVVRGIALPDRHVSKRNL